MTYLPHAVRAVSGQLFGIVRNATVSDNTGRGYGQDRLVLLDIDLVGTPGSRRLWGVRYYGVLTLPVTASSVNPSVGTYDALLQESYNSKTGSDPERWEAVRHDVHLALAGNLVVPVNVGGRWIVK